MPDSQLRLRWADDHRLQRRIDPKVENLPEYMQQPALHRKPAGSTRARAMALPKTNYCQRGLSHSWSPKVHACSWMSSKEDSENRPGYHCGFERIPFLRAHKAWLQHSSRGKAARQVAAYAGAAMLHFYTELPISHVQVMTCLLFETSVGRRRRHRGPGRCNPQTVKARLSSWNSRAPHPGWHRRPRRRPGEPPRWCSPSTSIPCSRSCGIPPSG